MLVIIIRLIIALCYLHSFIGKIRSGLENSQINIRNYAIMPQHLEKAAAIFLMSSEIGIVILLVSPFYRIGGLISLILAGLFIYAVSKSMLRGQKFPCGCFGSSGSLTISFGLFMLDLFIFSFSLFLVLHEPAISTNDLSLLGMLTSGSLLFFLSLQAIRAGLQKNRPLGIAMGKAAPNFQASLRDGTLIRAEDLYKEPTIFYFFLPTCSACYDFFSRIKDSAYTDTNVVIIGENQVGVMPVLKQFGLSDEKVIHHAYIQYLRSLFRIPGNPTLVFIEEGIVKYSLFPATEKNLDSLWATLASSLSADARVKP